MLAEILNSDLSAIILLELYRRDTVYASGLVRELNLTLSAVQKQLARFERSGILTSQEIGKTKLFSFNRQNPYVEPLMAMLKLTKDTESPPKNMSQANDFSQKAEEEKLWLY